MDANERQWGGALDGAVAQSRRCVCGSVDGRRVNDQEMMPAMRVDAFPPWGPCCNRRVAGLRSVGFGGSELSRL